MSITIFEVTTRINGKCFIHTTQGTSEEVVKKQSQFKDKEIIAITPIKHLNLGKTSLMKGVLA